jgi:hypothetical protein
MCTSPIALALRRSVALSTRLVCFTKPKEELYAPDRLLSFQLEEGDMLIIDNTRVLHGRSAFEISADATVTTAEPPLPAVPPFSTHGVDTGAGGPLDLSKFSRLRGQF